MNIFWRQLRLLEARRRARSKSRRGVYGHVGRLCWSGICRAICKPRRLACMAHLRINVTKRVSTVQKAVSRCFCKRDSVVARRAVEFGCGWCSGWMQQYDSINAAGLACAVFLFWHLTRAQTNQNSPCCIPESQESPENKGFCDTQGKGGKEADAREPTLFGSNVSPFMSLQRTFEVDTRPSGEDLLLF